MAENTQVDVSRLTFERAIEELETIVKRLEDGKVPLEESVTIYERGEALKRRCEELLRQAEARVDKITTDASGKATGTEPLDVQYAVGLRKSPDDAFFHGRICSWRLARPAIVPRSQGDSELSCASSTAISSTSRDTTP